MIDLSRVKLKEPWSDDPEGFFKTCDHMYSVKDLCIQRGFLSRAKVDREFRKFSITLMHLIRLLIPLS